MRPSPASSVSARPPRPNRKSSRPRRRLPQPPPRRRARDLDMKTTTLEGKEAGSVSLSDAIFGLDPRSDIIQRCVNWQLAKRQRGTHKTKDRSENWRTGKKMYAQKGTAVERHGLELLLHRRGAARSFCPFVRSHAIG